MIAKQLIKSRSLRFLHPDIVLASDEENITSILKAVGYFRNFAIFKALYTILYKGKNLSLDQYKTLYEQLVDYKVHHPNDFFIEGFSMAIEKSKAVKPETKALYAVMIYNQLNKDDLFLSYTSRTARRLAKAISMYYKKDKSINVAIIRKSKVMKINKGNIIKSTLSISKSR
jgi:hypothetical protein